jgi:hypothetical protein
MYARIVKHLDILILLETKSIIGVLNLLSSTKDHAGFRKVWNLLLTHRPDDIECIRNGVGPNVADLELIQFLNLPATTTLLNHAIKVKNIPTIKYLLAKGIAPTVAPANSYKAAAKTGSRIILELLIDYTSDAELKKKAANLFITTK